MEEKKIETPQPDREAIEAMQKEQIERGLSSEQELRRTELNALLELHSVIGMVQKALLELHNTITALGADKLTNYFKELSENVKKEEKRQETLKKVHASHKKARTAKK